MAEEILYRQDAGVAVITLNRGASLNSLNPALLDALYEALLSTARDDSVRAVNFPPESKVALGSDLREYELMTNLDGRRFEDVYTIDPVTGERKLALRKARWFRGASPDGSRLLYYDDGAYYTHDVATGKQVSITKNIATSFVDADNDLNVVKPPTPTMG